MENPPVEHEYIISVDANWINLLEVHGMSMIKKGLYTFAIMLNLSVLPASVAAQPATQARASPAAHQLALEQVLHATKGATWIAEGNGPRLVYIFFDPNCPFCHKLYQEARPWVGRDGLQLRWIPVGILMPSSAGKAAAILEAKNPLAAFRENEEKFGSAPKFGGIAESLPSPETEQRLRRNAELLEQSRMPGVPAMLFREASGKIRIVDGVPSPRLLNEMWRSVK
jgi:thiol:disulfide interchange protein DsbG